ncbi:recombination mediator RecR [Limisalsivibrio acetivorans]|uniref:recombination mediator RecR n=1 Tax=Limisalsivibrio acetivorans TaxID=1304888 RepID=UPI0003B69063|nr:recombination mediator RecR [Limisalsivibrio acetivorans]
MIRNRIFENCLHELSRLPGIGKKTAGRLALHILKMKDEDVKRLAESITTLKEKTVFCKLCGGISEGELCSICSDPYRDKSKICVVEEPRDIFILEATGSFTGLYHVLGGKISPLDGIGPDELNIADLLKKGASGEIEEVIIALNPDVEGETTAVYISRQLQNYPDISVTKIASGVPIGSHLEYTDEITLLKALEGRTRI